MPMAIAPLFQRFVDDELALAPALVARVARGHGPAARPLEGSGAGGGERIHYADLVTALQRSTRALREDLRRLAAPAGRARTSTSSATATAPNPRARASASS